MSDMAKKLLAIKEEIEDAKTEKANLEGGLKIHTKQLKEDFEVSTINEAKKKLIDLEKKKEEIEEELELLGRQIEKDYKDLL